MEHQPPALADLQRKHKLIKNPNVVHKERLSSLERAALSITKHVGTMGFFLVILGWTGFWLSWNTLAPRTARFDPFPAFVLWLFISNMIQIFLMPLIMVGQNLQGRDAEGRAEADYEVNVRAEEEIETILKHLENQNELMLLILKKLEKVE